MVAENWYCLCNFVLCVHQRLIVVIFIGQILGQELTVKFVSLFNQNWNASSIGFRLAVCDSLFNHRDEWEVLTGLDTAAGNDNELWLGVIDS